MSERKLAPEWSGKMRLETGSHPDTCGMGMGYVERGKTTDTDLGTDSAQPTGAKA
jgi:hypothetical protein